jgi:hypothetical protein
MMPRQSAWQMRAAVGRGPDMNDAMDFKQTAVSFNVLLPCLYSMTDSSRHCRLQSNDGQGGKGFLYWNRYAFGHLNTKLQDIK